MTFVKVHDVLLGSSIMKQPVETRWVWVTMLILCDQDGIVRGTPEYISRMAAVPQSEVDAAIAVLLAPDEKSTTKDYEGRRLIELSTNVWFVVNYQKYRELFSAEERRAKTRERVARHRARKQLASAATTSGNAHVTPCNACNAIAEAEAEAEGDPPNPPTGGERIPFAAIWKLAVRKSAREEARVLWDGEKNLINRKRMTVAEQQAALAAYPRDAADWKREQREESKIPHLRTWLYNRRWLDRESSQSEPEWIYETFRAEDFKSHEGHARWKEYVEWAADQPPRSAPPFATWLKGRRADAKTDH